MSKLMAKQQAFCREYVKDWSATKAAIRAGYSSKTAYSQGARLLKKVEVKKEIERRTAILEQESQTSIDTWLKKVLDVADMGI